MNDVNKAMAVFHSHIGGKLLNVVPMLLLFSLGFVLGMTCNSKFPNFYLSSVASSPSPSPPPVPSSPPPAPLPPQNPQVGLARFLEPSSVMHNMTDEELLWAASWRPSVRRYPYRRTPKVAFMLLTRGPLPLAPLWDRFFAGAGDVGLFTLIQMPVNLMQRNKRRWHHHGIFTLIQGKNDSAFPDQWNDSKRE